MKSHIPPNYVNPFELVAKGIEPDFDQVEKEMRAAGIQRQRLLLFEFLIHAPPAAEGDEKYMPPSTASELQEFLGLNSEDIDGDFGPTSRAALARYQSENDLDASGKVDRATWKHLARMQLNPLPPLSGRLSPDTPKN